MQPHRVAWSIRNLIGLHISKKAYRLRHFSAAQVHVAI